MKLRSTLFLFAGAAAMLAPIARAESIAAFTDTITTANASELGRPFRSGVPQTWSGLEAYGGVNSTSLTTTYNYKTYNFAASLFTGAPFVEVSVFDELNSANLFVVAYANSYNSSNRGANWLGDEGGSGNLTFYAGDPGEARAFDVVLPSTATNLTLLVTTAGAGGAGTNVPFDININAYADTLGDDPGATAATPEPSALLMTGTGLLGIAGAFRRRLFRTV